MFRAQVSSIRSPTTASVNSTKSGMVFRILNASVVGCVIELIDLPILYSLSCVILQIDTGCLHNYRTSFNHFIFLSSHSMLSSSREVFSRMSLSVI